MNKKTQIVSLLILTLLIGIVSGLLMAGIFFKYKVQSFTNDPEMRRELLVQKFTREMELSDEQAELLKESLVDFFASIEDEREAFQTAIKPELTKARDRIQDSLNEEQISRMNRIIRSLYPLFGSENPVTTE